jgi:nicotinamide-nucleotide amidase
MKVELISIGDELLYGQTINTNASWIGQQLAAIGARVLKTTTIGDTREAILKALQEVENETDAVIITGGLGPTKDDITKITLCEYFDTVLAIHPPTLAKIEAYFSMRNRPMLESNIQQAALPVNCTILENNLGTAAGMWFEKNDKIYVSLPGVPYEMKGLMELEVLPKLQSKFELSSIYHRTALTQGIGESFLAEIIRDWEDQLRKEGFGLAYLPSPGIVKLRITSFRGEEDTAKINDYFTQLETLIPKAIFGYEQQTLPEVVGEILRRKNLSIGTVESCTSGALAHSLTSISGSSDYFMGGLLTYSNALKTKLANVSIQTLEQFGAVSEETAIEMAKGGLKKLGVDVCISTTGVAGPNGGTTEKPVGMVWIGIAIKDQVFTHQFQFGDNRERNIQMSVLGALNFVRICLSNAFTEQK